MTWSRDEQSCREESVLKEWAGLSATQPRRSIEQLKKEELMRWRDLKIGGKLLTGFLSVALVLFVVGAPRFRTNNLA